MGMVDIDSTYILTNCTSIEFLKTAALMFAVALTEINGEMSSKTFALYHYFLSAVVLAWQLVRGPPPSGSIFF
jgi:hypothetical protein